MSIKAEHFDYSENDQILDINLKYNGGYDTPNHLIDLYDLSTAIYGLHRSLAITTHYILYDEIITKAPRVRGIKILSKPAAPGSFTIGAIIIAGAHFLGKATTAPRDTVLGHLTFSLYDYAVHKCLGKRVDFNKSLFDDHLGKDKLTEPKIESLSQKIESAVKDMHRPILTESADTSTITSSTGQKIFFNTNTLDALKKLQVDNEPKMFTGRVSGYNANTNHGMIYTEEESRAIPFEIDRESTVHTPYFTYSLALYNNLPSNKKRERDGYFKFMAKRVYTQAGMTKKYYITQIYAESFEKQ